MNVTDLHVALADLAGPLPPASPAARAEVTARVARARRRAGAFAVVGAIVVALLGAGVMRAFATGDGTEPVATTGPATCTRIPPAVSRARVPAAVSTWASGHPVVGGGSLWTERRVLRTQPVHEAGISRFKFGWLVVPYTPTTAAPTLTARRLDAAGRAVGHADPATDASGTWFASTIELPSTGCWRITARHAGDAIRVTRRVG